MSAIAQLALFAQAFAPCAIEVLHKVYYFGIYGQCLVDYTS